jgi:hypothetical protein
MQQEINWSLLMFWVPLFMMGGPYDSLIQDITILAEGGAAAGDAGVNAFHTHHPCFLESCRFSDNQQWYIEWDSMSLDPL